MRKLCILLIIAVIALVTSCDYFYQCQVDVDISSWTDDTPSDGWVRIAYQIYNTGDYDLTNVSVQFSAATTDPWNFSSVDPYTDWTYPVDLSIDEGSTINTIDIYTYGGSTVYGVAAVSVRMDNPPDDDK